MVQVLSHFADVAMRPRDVKGLAQGHIQLWVSDLKWELRPVCSWHSFLLCSVASDTKMHVDSSLDRRGSGWRCAIGSEPCAPSSRKTGL